MALVCVEHVDGETEQRVEIDHLEGGLVGGLQHHARRLGVNF